MNIIFEILRFGCHSHYNYNVLCLSGITPKRSSNSLYFQKWQYGKYFFFTIKYSQYHQQLYGQIQWYFFLLILFFSWSCLFLSISREDSSCSQTKSRIFSILYYSNLPPTRLRCKVEFFPPSNVAVILAWETFFLSANSTF